MEHDFCLSCLETEENCNERAKHSCGSWKRWFRKEWAGIRKVAKPLLEAKRRRQMEDRGR